MSLNPLDGIDCKFFTKTSKMRLSKEEREFKDFLKKNNSFDFTNEELNEIIKIRREYKSTDS